MLRRIPPLKQRIGPNVVRLIRGRCMSLQVVQQTLEFTTTNLQLIHQYSGLPWWALIPITTFTLRSLFTLPIAVLQRKRLQKQSVLRPLVTAMGPLLRLKLAQQASISQKLQRESIDFFPTEATKLNYEKIMILAAKESRKRQKKLFRDHGVQIWKNAILPVFQVPLWVTLSWTFRNLTGWHSFEQGNKPLDSSLIHEGFFWLHDLTVPDPYMILPVVLGSVALINLEWNNKTLEMRSSSAQGKKVSLRPTMMDAIMNLSRFSIAFLMVISTQAPVGLSLYWISSNLYSLGQNMILDKYLPISYTPNERHTQGISHNKHNLISDN
ncbi:hypothetical protein LJB42_003663 [Komagataella kurtzmanii]|nr:hypothetical protein LJB42_003663 [Komagataella kurtzmanii]